MKKTKTRIKTKVKTKVKTKSSARTTKQNNPKNSNSFIIIECWNDKFNYLKTDKLRIYLKNLKMIENNSIRNSDLATLKKLHKPITNNCKNQLLLHKLNPLSSIKYVNFIWQTAVENVLDKRAYKLNCYLTNIIAVEKLKCVTNKGLLFKNISKLEPNIAKKHLADTFVINNYSKYDFANSKYYILRPVESFAGKDILYVSSRMELNNAIKFYNTNKNNKGMVYGSNVIASEYIINPLLFRGYKFHLRMYLIISYIDKIFNSFFMEEGDILTADKPYNITKPFLKAVHDTHQTSSNDDYFFPQDLKPFLVEHNIKLDDLISQMRDIMKCVSRIIKEDSNAYLYENQENGFYISGIDFMIDDTGKVILIEVNEKPGFGYNKPINDIKWSSKFFTFINEVILEPTFKYKDQLIARKHNTYLDI